MESEAVYYPTSKGYSGKAYFLNAIIDLARGVSFDRVIEKYRLKGKKHPVIKDERKHFLDLKENRMDKAEKKLIYNDKMSQNKPL